MNGTSWELANKIKMEEKMKRLVIVMVLIVGVIASMAAFERDCDGMEKGKMQHDKQIGCNDKKMKDKGGDHFGMMLKELDLTEVQQEKIAGFMSAHKKEMIQLKADIDVKLVDKRTMMKDHDFAKIKKITSQIFDLKESIALKKIENHESIWNILTPEQQEKADEMKKEGHQKKQMMKHKKMIEQNK